MRKEISKTVAMSFPAQSVCHSVYKDELLLKSIPAPCVLVVSTTRAEHQHMMCGALTNVLTPITPLYSLVLSEDTLLIFPARLVVIVNTRGSIAIMKEKLVNPLLLFLTQFINPPMVTIIDKATSEMGFH